MRPDNAGSNVIAKPSGVVAGTGRASTPDPITQAFGDDGRDPFKKRGKGNAGAGGTSGQANAKSKKIVNLSSKPVVWNPPPHTMTKAPKFDWHSDSYSTDIANGQPDLSNRDINRVRAGRLGALYTWDFTSNLDVIAEEANSEEYKKALEEGGELALGRFSNRYGVVFHYNPTSISYSVQSNEQIPAMNTAGDSGNLIIPGTSAVTIDLYFNRIYDLSYVSSRSKGQYERNLTYDEMNGIWNRGTEYDIEFLYRTCNGDPGDVYNVDYKTADYGFFMRVPVVLHVGSMQWIGFITSVTVNHILFNTNMIPTFSQVSIGFARMITMGRSTPGNPTGSGEAAVITAGAGATPVEAGQE
jgi:hypothetical protein